MEFLNIFLVVLAVLGSVLAQSDLAEGHVGDYQQAVDDALSTIKASSDQAKVLTDEALAKIEDNVNTINLAFAEARFSLVHVANFAAVNNLTELEDMVPDDPSNACVSKELVSSITGVLTDTAANMLGCFTQKIEEAKSIQKDIVDLDGEVTDIVPNAAAKLDKCSEAQDVTCVQAETDAILEGIANLEKAVREDVLQADELIGSFHDHLEQCMGHAAVTFVADIGKIGSKMVSCFVKGI